MKTIEQINQDILELRHSGQSVKKISDGYHTFGDYIDMRNIYFIALCNAYPELSWKSKKHFDEENDPMFEGDFIAGIFTPDGPITQHLKLKFWDELSVQEIERAPQYDGYTEEDVKIRIKSLNRGIYGKKDKILEIIKLIRNSNSNEEGRKILLQNFQELLADEEIDLMIKDNRRKGQISKFFDGDFSSMEKWFADHVEELREDFEWKKKLETKEIIKNDTNYIEWLVYFMKRERKIDDDTWLYCNKELTEKDKENVAKIDSFVDVIVDYAEEKNIPSINNDYGYSYNVKYKDTVLKISVLHGHRIITDIELITNEVPEELLDFEDIIKDSKPKILTKTRTKEKNATKQD